MNNNIRYRPVYKDSAVSYWNVTLPMEKKKKYEKHIGTILIIAPPGALERYQIIGQEKLYTKRKDAGATLLNNFLKEEANSN